MPPHVWSDLCGKLQLHSLAQGGGNVQAPVDKLFDGLQGLCVALYLYTLVGKVEDMKGTFLHGLPLYCSTALEGYSGNR